jgi:ADP-heptose:LPS heptosyltransferase
MTPAQPTTRILVIAEGQIGDLLLLTPVFRALRRKFPSSDLSLLTVERRPTTSRNEAVIAKSMDHFLCNDPHLSSVHILRRDILRSLKGSSRLKAEWRIIRYLRDLECDTIISAFRDDRFSIAAWLSRATVRIGEANRNLGWTYTRSPVRKKGEGSILDYFCELAELAGCTVESRKTVFAPSIQNERWAEGFLKDSGLQPGMFVLVHPGATGDYKIWPPERYAALIRKLADRSGRSILLCGGMQDHVLIEKIADPHREENVKVYVEKDVDRFAALAKRAALVISNDSGPRHMAVAVGTPSLAIFRLFHDREWGVYEESETVRIVQSRIPCKLCPPGFCKDMMPEGVLYGSECLHSIDAERVVDEAMDMLR